MLFDWPIMIQCVICHLVALITLELIKDSIKFSLLPDTKTLKNERKCTFTSHESFYK